MTLDILIMFSGAFVALIPFLGFPLKWDNIILVILGVVIIIFGIIVRRRGLNRRSAVKKAESFVESIPHVRSETHEA